MLTICTRYADDITFLEDITEDIQNLLNVVSDSYQQLGLMINVPKTKGIMVHKINVDQVILEDEIAKKVITNFLEAQQGPEISSFEEVIARIEMCRNTFRKWRLSDAIYSQFYHTIARHGL